MKVCLYFENYENVKQSGVGKARQHQVKALESLGIDYTFNPNDDYDILHINTIFFFFFSTIKKARKKGAKVIYHAHSTPEDTRNSFIGSNIVTPLLKKYLVHIYNLADVVITPTEYSKSLLIKHGITKPIFPLSNGVNLNRFKKSQEKAEIFRNYFNLSKDDKVVVSAGLWIKRKGIFDFVELAKKEPDIKFIWFGRTNPYIIPPKIRRLVFKNHPKNCIFPGYMSGDVFEGSFTGADLFFFPSLEETEGIVILEALASRVPILIRDIPVYSGWMKNGYNCYIGKDVNDFSLLLNKILNSDNSEIIENGYKTVTERSITDIGVKLGEIYKFAIELDK